MGEINWTEEAERWLRDIHDYIAQDSPESAVLVVEAILASRRLQFPRGFNPVAVAILGIAANQDQQNIFLGQLQPQLLTLLFDVWFLIDQARENDDLSRAVEIL